MQDFNNNLGGSKRKNYKSLRIVYIICLLIIFVCLVFSPIKNSFLRKYSGEKASTSKKQQMVQARPILVDGEKKSLPVKDLPSLSITGIFFTDGEYMALVNDKMVRVGDFVEEVQIGKIDSNGVEIEFKGSTFRLNYP